MDFQNKFDRRAFLRNGFFLALGAEVSAAFNGHLLQIVGKGGGNVIPPPDSQIKSEVGYHWLRLSFSRRDLEQAEQVVSSVFGESEQDEFGLWSYTDRYSWFNGASINYDSDPERSERVHKGRATLDVPGSACDELTPADLTLFMNFFEAIGANCSRIDVFWDDYRRIINPRDLQPVIEGGDYSGFRKANFSRTFRGKELDYDIATFGGRGGKGGGKYLRVYDKHLESKGEKDCVRWECEFSHEKADKVFKKLSAAGGNLEAFTTICGGIIAGCVTFVKRTGDKNVKRLERYEWWLEILAILGSEIAIRVERKRETVTEKMEWIRRSVSPSLACLQTVFKTHSEFFHWLWDLLDDAESRMSNSTRDVAKTFDSTVSYDQQNKQVQMNAKFGLPYEKMS